MAAGDGRFEGEGVVPNITYEQWLIGQVMNAIISNDEELNNVRALAREKEQLFEVELMHRCRNFAKVARDAHSMWENDSFS